MRIYFRTRKLQKLCSTKKEAEAKLGHKMAARLFQRMMELSAAGTLKDISHLPPARCHELTADRRGQLSVDLEHPYRLIFIVANGPIPRREDGGLDWASVTEIEITEITDPHPY
jgi:plasmid maintenance system killer protein